MGEAMGGKGEELLRILLSCFDALRPSKHITLYISPAAIFSLVFFAVLFRHDISIRGSATGGRESEQPSSGGTQFNIPIFSIPSPPPAKARDCLRLPRSLPPSDAASRLHSTPILSHLTNELLHILIPSSAIPRMQLLLRIHIYTTGES